MYENNQAGSTEKKLQKFFTPIERDWRCLEKSKSGETNEEQEIKRNNDSLREMLLSALQMPNLVVLSGSGTLILPQFHGHPTKRLF